MADLEEAIALARQAVDSTPVDHPDRAGRLGSLGSKLQRRYERTRDLADLEGASSRLHAAWCCQVAIPFYRVQAAARCLPLLVIQSKIDRAIQLKLCRPRPTAGREQQAYGPQRPAVRHVDLRRHRC